MDSLDTMFATLSAPQDGAKAGATALARPLHYVIEPRAVASSVTLAAPEFEAMLTTILHDEMKVFMTPSRQALFARFAARLHRLDAPNGSPNRLRDHGCCSVLVAQRGSGKSLILNALALTASRLSHRTFTCYLNFKTSEAAPLWQLFVKLVTALDARFEPYLRRVRNIDQLHDTLEAATLRVVFLVDELEYVYGMPASVGVPIIRDLVAIGERRGPRTMMAMVAGTYKLRRLCFTKLRHNEAAELPSYNAMGDFNGRKYDVLELQPISSKAELIDAMTCMGLSCLTSAATPADDGLREALPDTAALPLASGAATTQSVVTVASGDDFVTAAHVDRTDADVPEILSHASLSRLFLASRGVAGVLADLCGTGRGVLQGFLALKRHKSKLHIVWRALASAIIDSRGAAEFDALLSRLHEDVFSVTLPVVSIAAVRSAVSHVAGDEVDSATLWDLADSGWLTVAASADHDGGMAVAFRHVSDFDWSVGNLTDSVGASVVT